MGRGVSMSIKNRMYYLSRDAIKFNLEFIYILGIETAKD